MDETTNTWARAGALLALLLASCATGGAPTRQDAGAARPDAPGAPSLDGGGTVVDAARAREDASASDDAAIGSDAGRAIRGLELEHLSRELVCKLISGDELTWESENRTHTRFNLRGTDLGTPAIVGDQLHLFFGDTHGFRRIWVPGEDPDSIARVSLPRARADLRTLCRELDFYVTSDVPSVAAVEDARIERDFEGAFLGPPPGRSIREFLDRPTLEQSWGAFAGSFEVPTGAITHGGQTYVYWSTRVGSGEIGPMRLSFVAHWETAGSSPLFQRILHEVDDLDGARPLGGHFIQNAPLSRDGYLYLFGTGLYRRDGVHLARKPIADIASPGGFELYDPRSGSWAAAASLSEDARAAIPAIIDEDVRGIGELGVQYVEEAGVYVLMYQQLSDRSGGNRMVMQVAARPEGPWSGATIILMHDPEFVARHCCLPGAATCPGERVIRCDQGGLYGIYPLPLIETTPRDGGWELRVPFVASTWVPYNVVLFRTTVFVRPRFD